MTVNRDGSYMHFMTPRQQQEQLAKREREMRALRVNAPSICRISDHISFVESTLR